MSTEFRINSSAIENKINQLLPSQGGMGAGVDFSASTMVVPVVNLTEAAEGSNLRQDLQSSMSLNSITSQSFNNVTDTIVSTTGYYRVFGNVYSSGAGNSVITVTDGTTTKNILPIFGTAGLTENDFFDFNVLLEAGQSLQAVCSGSSTLFIVTRQLADLSGNLVNP